MPGTPALNLVDQAKGADQENVTTLPLLIMGMHVMDKAMSLKLAIHTRAQVNSVPTKKQICYYRCDQITLPVCLKACRGLNN